MLEFAVIPGSDASAWSAVLNELGGGDVYYSHPYVYTFEANGDGQAHLIVFRHPLGTVVHPVLIRPVFVSKVDTGYVDMISPYGYAGPLIAPTDGQLEIESLCRAFVQAMHSYCRENRVVSELVRFHPLLRNYQYFAPHIPVVYVRDTVYVDLRTPIDELWRADFAGRARNDIRRALRAGVTVVFGREPRMLETFQQLYLNTMEQVGASRYYFFSDSFFKALAALVMRDGIVVEARLGDRAIASSILLYGTQYLHYHLSGSDPAYRSVPSTSLILYQAIEWGRAAGLTCFHLGGGFAGNNDGLFRFKAGFSRGRAQYMLGKVIHMPEVYADLVEKTKRSAASSDYFPAYRSPQSYGE